MSLTTRPSTPPAGQRSLAPGTFHLLGDGDALAWSEPVYRMHGFEPGEVVPSTALMLAHCHRDDRSALEAVLRAAPAEGHDGPDGQGRSVRYRLLDTAGQERVVLAVLSPSADPSHGARHDHRAPTEAVPVPVGGGSRQGLLVDLGAEIGATAARRADDMLAAAIASREVIDQAKGVAMLAYGLDGEAAFEFLRWHSEHLNVKVRTLAERLLETLPARRGDGDPREILDAALAELGGVPGTAGGPPRGAGGTALPARLSVTHTTEGRTVVASLQGEVDGATAPALVSGLAEALRAVPARGTLVIDAARLAHLGPVAALHVGRLRRRAENAGVQLRVIPPSGRAEMREDGRGASM
ncbi:ANTAR domain-containing protein [Cellulomonas sp. Marseille-Q8402]